MKKMTPCTVVILYMQLCVHSLRAPLYSLNKWPWVLGHSLINCNAVSILYAFINAGIASASEHYVRDRDSTSTVRGNYY